MIKIIVLSIIFSFSIFSQSEYLNMECNSKNILDSLDLSEFDYSTDGGIIFKLFCKDKYFYEVELYGESYNSKTRIFHHDNQFIIHEVNTKYNVPYYDTINFDINKAKIDTTIINIQSDVKNKFSFYLDIIDILNKIADGNYGLSHIFLNSDTTKIIATPEDYIVIKKDSIFYYEFEPYIPTIRGILKNNYFIFDNKDSIKFVPVKNGFKTFKDSLIYNWYQSESEQ